MSKPVRAKRVLLLTHGSLHHEGPQVRYLAERLAHVGCAVELLGPISPNVHIPGVAVGRLRPGRRGRIWLPIRGLWREILNRYDAAIAVDEVAAIPVLLSSLLRKKGVFRALYFLDFMDDLKLSRIYIPARWIIRTLAGRANMIVDSNEHRCALRMQALGAKTLYLAMHNCPPLSNVHRAELMDSAFDGVPEGTVRIVYTGTLAPSVCLEPVIHAVGLIRHPVCLLVVGNDQSAYGTQLKQLAQSLVESGRCKFVGFVPRPRLSPILAGADIGLALYSSRPDTCLCELYCAPNKLYEYMAAGLPVVASNNPPLISLVEQNGWGFCVQPDDPRSIAGALERLSSEPGLRKTFSTRALQLHHTTMNFEAQVEPLLAGILGRGQVRI